MSLDDRKDAFEKKYAHDQELLFKVEARTSKLFGLWVAEQIGLSGAEADAYAKEVVAANLEEAGFEDINRKVKPDLSAKGHDVSDHVLDRKIEEFFEEAQKQLVQ
jgi:hypothetical protein